MMLLLLHFASLMLILAAILLILDQIVKRGSKGILNINTSFRRWINIFYLLPVLVCVGLRAFLLCPHGEKCRGGRQKQGTEKPVAQKDTIDAEDNGDNSEDFNRAAGSGVGTWMDP